MQTSYHIPNYSDIVFNNPTAGKISSNEAVNEIQEYIHTKQEANYQLTVGTDSQPGKESCSFAVVIAIRRIGQGGRFFWHRFVVNQSYPTLRKRIYDEVNVSLHLAKWICNNYNFKLPNVQFEIHVDIGHNGPTSTMVNEITGLIHGQAKKHGNDYKPKTKKSSYCASNIADQYV